MMNPMINTYDEVLDMKERIKMLRKTLGLTQQKFAERLGVKRNKRSNRSGNNLYM